METEEYVIFHKSALFPTILIHIWLFSKFSGHADTTIGAHTRAHIVQKCAGMSADVGIGYEVSISITLEAY